MLDCESGQSILVQEANHGSSPAERTGKVKFTRHGVVVGAAALLACMIVLWLAFSPSPSPDIAMPSIHAASKNETAAETAAAETAAAETAAAETLPKFDTGNTSFMLVSSALVMIMTPGLAFFYGGLVGHSSVLAIMFQSFVSMGITTVIWWAVGWSLCFHGGKGQFFGDFDQSFLLNTSMNDEFAPGLPLYVVFGYQMMFAVITPALITGAFTDRIHFNAYVVFIVIWLLVIYFPFCHSVWGGGMLAEWGVRDFAGGIVVHATAGAAALASVLFTGKRHNIDRAQNPHNIPFVALGTALLWFGWYGFNAGSELSVDAITVAAFINTDIAASVAALMWMILDTYHTGKPKLVGFLTGTIAGLATITPAAGFVETWTSPIFGIIASLVCFNAIKLVSKLGLDDALDVWGVHGVGGSIGTILLGLLGNTKVNANGQDGWFYGDGQFFGKQVAAIVFASVYAFVISYGILFILQKLGMRVVIDAEEQKKVDAILHGEEAYLKTKRERREFMRQISGISGTDLFGGLMEDSPENSPSMKGKSHKSMGKGKEDPLHDIVIRGGPAQPPHEDLGAGLDFRGPPKKIELRPLVASTSQPLPTAVTFPPATSADTQAGPVPVHLQVGTSPKQPRENTPTRSRPKSESPKKTENAQSDSAAPATPDSTSSAQKKPSKSPRRRRPRSQKSDTEGEKGEKGNGAPSAEGVTSDWASVAAGGDAAAADTPNKKPRRKKKKPRTPRNNKQDAPLLGEH